MEPWTECGICGIWSSWNIKSRSLYAYLSDTGTYCRRIERFVSGGWSHGGKKTGKKEYEEAYTESKKIMYAGLIGSVIVAAFLILFAGVYTGLYRVDDNVKELGKILLIVFALYAPIKVENMILGGGIIRSGGNTRIIMLIDIIGTWCIGIPLCFLAAYALKWGIVGVYALLTTEEIFRLLVSLVIFRRRKWMISLS